MESILKSKHGKVSRKDKSFELPHSEPIDSPQKLCEVCLTPLNKRQQRFCSVKCQNRKRIDKARKHLNCVVCGEDIRNKGKTYRAKTCCDECMDKLKKQRMFEYNKMYRIKNKEEMLEYARQYREKNRDWMNYKQRQRRIDNPEPLRAQGRKATLRRLAIKKRTIDEVKKIGKTFGVKPCRIKGTKIIQIRKNPSDKYEDISWDDFEKGLKDRELVIYKSEKGNFLKIMKEK